MYRLNGLCYVCSFSVCFEFLCMRPPTEFNHGELSMSTFKFMQAYTRLGRSCLRNGKFVCQLLQPDNIESQQTLAVAYLLSHNGSCAWHEYNTSRQRSIMALHITTFPSPLQTDSNPICIHEMTRHLMLPLDPPKSAVKRRDVKLQH